MLSLYRTLSFRYLRRRWSRATLIVASIALGVATWVATGALNASLEKVVCQAAAPLAGLADLYVSNSDHGVPHGLAEQIRHVPGVRGVQKLVVDTVQVRLPATAGRPATYESAILLGVDLDAVGEESAADWGVVVEDSAMVRYGMARVQRLFDRSRPQPVIVGRKLHQALKDSPEFHILAGGEERQLRCAGAIDARGQAATLGGNVLVMDYLAAAALLDRDNRVTRLDVLLMPGTNREAVKLQIEAELATALAGDLLAGSPQATFPGNMPWAALSPMLATPQVTTSDTFNQPVKDLLSGLKVAFALCGAGALVVGVFLVYNSLAVSVAERRHDIGVLRSIGATRSQIGSLFVGESLMLGLVGTLLGVPLGLLLAQAVLGPVQEVLNDVFLPLPRQQVQLSPGSILWAMLAGMTTTLLAALVPAARAAAGEPSDVLRRVPPTTHMVHCILQLGASLLLLGAGSILISSREYLPPLMGSCGGLILFVLALLLATPLLSAIVARLLQPAARYLLGPEERLAADNLARSPGRTGLVIAAVSAGVALMLMIAGMIRSSTEAIPKWLDDSVTADLFVTSGGPFSSSGQNIAMKENVLDELKQEFPELRVMPVTFRWSRWQRAAGDTEILLALLDANIYHEANLARHPSAPRLELFRRLGVEPGTAIVSENFAAQYHVKVGDSITLPSAGSPVPFEVIGTLTDYSWPRGAVLVHRSEQNVHLFDAHKADVLDIYRPDNVTNETIRERVQQSPWGAKYALFATTQGELRKHVDGIFVRLSRILYAMVIMVGVVASLGVVSALLISVLQRRRELGMLRAIGATRAQVLRSVLAEAVLMGAIGAVIGLLAGVPLEWYVLERILLEETGFLFAVVIPWQEAGVIGVLAIVAATLAGLGPAWHALRMRIPEAVAYE